MCKIRYKTITLGVNLLHESSVEFYVDRDDYKDFGDKYLDIECVYVDTDIIKKEGGEQSLDDLERRIEYYLDGLTEDEKYDVKDLFVGFASEILLRLGQTDELTNITESINCMWEIDVIDGFIIEDAITGETLKSKK